jgi:uncharacterized damage-inducible protein DinB
MDAKPHFLALARYNLWATQCVLDACDKVPDEAYRRDIGLFFKSLHGTLNHLIVGGDLIWYPRFAQGISPKALAHDMEVEHDRAALRRRLVQSGERWHALVEGFDATRYDGQLDYITMRGTRAVLPFAATLAHVFNHGTHHRGQLHAGLTLLGHPGPELDLVYMLQQEAAI